MRLIDDKYRVTIQPDVTFSINSTDNRPYDKLIKIRNAPACTYEMIIESMAENINYRIVVVASYCTRIMNDSAFLEMGKLYVLFDDSIVVLSLNGMNYKIINIPKPFGTYYSLYHYKCRYIIYGELEVLVLDKMFQELWRYSTQDILVNSEYKLIIEDDCISFEDWDGNHHKLDMNGKVLT